LAGIVLSVFGAEKAINHAAPDFEGSKQVTLHDGDKLSNIANKEIEGGSGHTGAVVDEIVKRNPAIFQNGTPFVGHEDLGKEIDVPEKVS